MVIPSLGRKVQNGHEIPCVRKQRSYQRFRLCQKDAGVRLEVSRDQRWDNLASKETHNYNRLKYKYRRIQEFK